MERAGDQVPDRGLLSSVNTLPGKRLTPPDLSENRASDNVRSEACSLAVGFALQGDLCESTFRRSVPMAENQSTLPAVDTIYMGVPDENLR